MVGMETKSATKYKIAASAGVLNGIVGIKVIEVVLKMLMVSKH